MTSEDKIETVIVGVDGSPESEQALAWAARYARAVGARLQAIMAWHYPSVAGGPPAGIAPATVTSEVEQSRYEIIDKLIAATCGNKPGLRIERRLVYGHPALALIQESKAADLLVVGHRGHGGFSGMLLGSVSAQCVAHASCPVTVVRHS